MSRTKPSGWSRRQFLKTSLAVAPAVITSNALGAGAVPPASDRIVMGAIGIGGRGSSDLGSFLTHSDVQVVAVCDVKRTNRLRAQGMANGRYGNKDCKAYIDLRELLERADIDSVLIATGDQWHTMAAILAARAGKDMYCEKPMSLVVSESRALSDTMKRYARIFQCGTQRRSVGQFVFAINLARSGKLGKIHTVIAEKAPWYIGGNSETLAPQPEPAREEFDWDMWLGPAPWRAYNAQYSSRRFWAGHWDFAGCSITEWGSHTVDLCQAALNADDTSPVFYEPDGPGGNDVRATYADGTKLHIRRGLRFGSCPVRFEGTEGWVEVGDSGQVETFPKSLMAMRRFRGGYPQHGHVRNFLNCVKTRQQPAAPAEGAHRSISACHVGNIAIRLGRPVKWDPKTESVIGDPEAQRMTIRPYRSPWRL